METAGRLLPGAALLPVGTIDEDTAGEVIPEKDSTVLVYCRSGINTWPYDIEQ